MHSLIIALAVLALAILGAAAIVMAIGNADQDADNIGSTHS